MTNYQMPVLTDEEKARQIDVIVKSISHIVDDCANGWTVERVYLLPLQIALASLTAEPLAATEKHEISNMHATGLYIRAWPMDRRLNAQEGYTTELYTAPPVPALNVPHGWKLVPIEPTEDMVIYGFESAPDEFWTDPDEWEEYEAMSGCRQAAHRAKLCWAAMLAATPPLPTSVLQKIELPAPERL